MTVSPGLNTREYTIPIDEPQIFVTDRRRMLLGDLNGDFEVGTPDLLLLLQLGTGM